MTASYSYKATPQTHGTASSSRDTMSHTSCPSTTAPSRCHRYETPTHAAVGREGSDEGRCAACPLRALTRPPGNRRSSRPPRRITSLYLLSQIVTVKWTSFLQVQLLSQQARYKSSITQKCVSSFLNETPRTGVQVNGHTQGKMVGRN